VDQGGGVSIMKPVRFSVIGINHNHIYGQVGAMLHGGAEFVSFYAKEPELRQQFASAFPTIKQVNDQVEILEDESIHLVLTSAILNERAPLGIQVMKHGKDFMSDKPGFTSLDQLAEAREVQAETNRIYSICFSERLENRASVRAGELIHSGAIGRVIQTIGLGPHRINIPSRASWFFKKEQYGGILCDIASHQVDQFLYFTNSISAEVVQSQVGNFNHPEYPELEDFGDIILRSSHATGYVRVDWFTPDGLPIWGDGRMFILGTDGYIELRKYVDINGKPGGNHLFLVDKAGVHYIDCADVELPYGSQLVSDVINRTETAMPQAHCFLASELALKAEVNAVWIYGERPKFNG
jgi:predicted dehydrogenase